MNEAHTDCVWDNCHHALRSWKCNKKNFLLIFPLFRYIFRSILRSSKSFVWLNLSDAVDREAGYERTPAVRTFSAKYWLLFEWAKWVHKGNQMLPVLLLLVMESKQHPWWSLNHKKVSGLWYWPFILTPCRRDWFSTALWCVWDWFDCNYFIRFSRRYYYWQIMQ